jgi:hypothetical protein
MSSVQRTADGIYPSGSAASAVEKPCSAIFNVGSDGVE